MLLIRFISFLLRMLVWRKITQTHRFIASRSRTAKTITTYFHLQQHSTYQTFREYHFNCSWACALDHIDKQTILPVFFRFASLVHLNFWWIQLQHAYTVKFIANVQIYEGWGSPRSHLYWFDLFGCHRRWKLFLEMC